MRSMRGNLFPPEILAIKPEDSLCLHDSEATWENFMEGYKKVRGVDLQKIEKSWGEFWN